MADLGGEEKNEGLAKDGEEAMCVIHGSRRKVELMIVCLYVCTCVARIDQSCALILFSYGSAGDGGVRKQRVMCRKDCVRKSDRKQCMNF